MPRSFNTLLNLILSQFSSVLYVPADMPIPNFDIPPDMPTTQRSCDIADIDGADAEFTTLLSPEYAFVVFVVVEFDDEPFSYVVVASCEYPPDMVVLLPLVFV
jgi:hypothetical protein